MINPKDQRIKAKEEVVAIKSKLDGRELQLKEKEKISMFFAYNTALGPPYHILIDTNFINFSIQNKIDIFQESMDCLLAKCVLYVTDCVVAELEKMGHRYSIALKIAKDPRFERLSCTHKGTYVDDCIVERVRQVWC